MQWRLYSLRRGGATDEFATNGNYDLLTERGRWASVRTAKIYVNQAMAELSTIQTTAAQMRTQNHYAQFLANLL